MRWLVVAVTHRRPLLLEFTKGLQPYIGSVLKVTSRWSNEAPKDAKEWNMSTPRCHVSFDLTICSVHSVRGWESCKRECQRSHPYYIQTAARNTWSAWPPIYIVLKYTSNYWRDHLLFLASGHQQLRKPRRLLNLNLFEIFHGSNWSITRWSCQLAH